MVHCLLQSHQRGTNTPTTTRHYQLMEDKSL
uniref:Uncharacterized protein n=1 Tax=Arundo donax TaxID=35708 RepID=A0A0A8XYE3_ARUDO